MSGIALHLASQFFEFARTLNRAAYDENWREFKKVRSQGVGFFPDMLRITSQYCTSILVGTYWKFWNRVVLKPKQTADTSRNFIVDLPKPKMRHPNKTTWTWHWFKISNTHRDSWTWSVLNFLGNLYFGLCTVWHHKSGLEMRESGQG